MLDIACKTFRELFYFCLQAIGYHYADKLFLKLEAIIIMEPGICGLVVSELV